MEYKARQSFFSKEKNKELYKSKSMHRHFDTELKAYVFPQMWGSTSLGFDVDENGGAMFGGQMMTEAYTTVFYEPITETYLVFFGDKICYQVQNANDKFLHDLKKGTLKPLSKAKQFY